MYLKAVRMKNDKEIKYEIQKKKAKSVIPYFYVWKRVKDIYDKNAFSFRCHFILFPLLCGKLYIHVQQI